MFVCQSYRLRYGFLITISNFIRMKKTWPVVLLPTSIGRYLSCQVPEWIMSGFRIRFYLEQDDRLQPAYLLPTSFVTDAFQNNETFFSQQSLRQTIISPNLKIF